MTDNFNRMEFAARLAIECQCKPYVAAAHAETLIRFGRAIQRFNETACNVGLTDAQEKQRERKVEAIRGYLAKEFGPGFSVFINGDPRGAALKLRVPSGANNDFGGDGICVPD
jgi:hypothetical protein